MIICLLSKSHSDPLAYKLHAHIHFICMAWFCNKIICNKQVFMQIINSAVSQFGFTVSSCHHPEAHRIWLYQWCLTCSVPLSSETQTLRLKTHFSLPAIAWQQERVGGRRVPLAPLNQKVFLLWCGHAQQQI